MKGYMLLITITISCICFPMSNAFGALIFSDTDIFTGAGFGTSDNILTLQQPTQSTSETGSVEWGGTADILGGTGVITGDNKTRTYTFGELGITDASQIIFEWNPAETGGGQSTTVELLAMTIWEDDGTLVLTEVLEAPVTHPETIYPGVGGTGFDYILNNPGEVNAKLSVISDISTLRIGLSNTTLSVDNGPDTWIVAAGPVVPIPAAVWLLGSGLFGIALIRRRK